MLLVAEAEIQHGKPHSISSQQPLARVVPQKWTQSKWPQNQKGAYIDCRTI